MAAVDVLMPVRDVAPWVAGAWASLHRQTFPDWRLVAVDDGSADGTGEVLTRAAAGDRRLRLVTQEPRGVAAALNRALAEATAPVVVRMDGDDLCHPQRLGALRQALTEPSGTGVVASRVKLFPRSSVSPAMARYLRWQNGLLEPDALARERYVECTVTHATAGFRTDVLRAAGGWWEGPGPEDLDLFLRLHARGVRFRKLPRVLYWWRERAGRETRTSPRMSGQAFRRAKVRHLIRETRGRRVGVYGRGSSLAAWVDALAEAGLHVAGEEYRPGGPAPAWEGLALFCFGHPGARERTRQALGGWREGEDYFFVA